MAAPFYSSGLIHVPQPLVDLCVAYDPSSDAHIRNKFFPRRPVAHTSDYIRTIDKSQMLRLYDLEMAPNSIAPTVSFKPGSNLQYNCTPFGARAAVNQYDVANADAALQFEMRATKQALLSVGVRMEYLAVISTLRSASVMTNNRTLAAPQYWDNYGSADSDPIADLIPAVSLVRVRSGKPSGKVLVAMHQFVWDRVRQHPNVIARCLYSGAPGALITKEIFASVIGLNSADDLVITSAHFTSSKEGASTTTYSSFIGPDVIVGFSDDGGLDDQALGHEFAFNGLVGDDPFFVRKYRVEQEGMMGQDYVQVGVSADYKVTNVDAGFLLKTVVDTSNTALYGTFLQ